MSGGEIITNSLTYRLAGTLLYYCTVSKSFLYARHFVAYSAKKAAVIYSYSDTRRFFKTLCESCVSITGVGGRFLKKEEFKQMATIMKSSYLFNILNLKI